MRTYNADDGPQSLLDRFWDHMGERYGKPWFEKYGPVIPRAWTQSLLSMTPEEARAGIKHMMAREDIYGLPTLSDFERSCVAALRANAPRSQTYKRLPEPKGAKANRMTKASEHCEKMRAEIEKAGDRS